MHKTKVSIIGGGNVAHHLIYRFQTAGISISHVYVRSYAAQNDLAEQFNIEVMNVPESIDDDSDILIIAVNDDSISDLKISTTDKLVVHTSGNVSLNTLNNISENIGVFYPLQSLRSDNFDDERIEIPFLIEASNNKSLRKLEDLSGSIGSDFIQADEDTRRLIHLAAVFAHNFTNHMWSISDQLLNKEKISFEIIKPLILNSIAQLRDRSPLELQTGPALRKDSNTMQSHLHLLKESEDWTVLYKIISESIKKTHHD
ncbi:MAG: DUF2520 domain-containing protein [Chitinophagales bacterium]|nr:DUF2520 domain-containing protein [Chitinophagales bacterium]